MKNYMRTRLMLSLRMLKGLLFIEVLLAKIKLAKEIFVLDVEQGQDVFILDDLSQRHLPLSFRFYDPIIRITFNQMSNTSKLLYSSNTKGKMVTHQRGNIWK